MDSWGSQLYDGRRHYILPGMLQAGKKQIDKLAHFCFLMINGCKNIFTQF